MREPQSDHQSFPFLAVAGEGGKCIRTFDWWKTGDNAPAMPWITEPDGSCSFLSQDWYEFSGQTEDEARGFGWLQVVHPEDRGESGRVFLEANAKREAFTLNYRLRRADGEYRWCLDAGWPRFDEAGIFQGYVGSVLDITERKRAEEALSASEMKYRSLFEAIDEGFCIIEVLFVDENPIDYRFLEVNPSFERQTGLINARGRRIRDLTPQHEQYWFETYGRIAISGRPERFQNRAEQLGRWYDVFAFRVGKPESRRVAVLFNDITEQHQAEEALRKSEERLRLAMEAGKMGAWEIDVRSGAVIWDATQRQIVGKPLDRAPTTVEEFYTFLHPEDVMRIKQATADAKLNGRFQEEFRVVVDGGVARWMVGIGTTLADQEGRPVRMIGVNYDVTERKEAQARLQRFTEELERRVTARTAELLESEARLRALASELSLTEQRERRRLATDLHDHLQQMLVLGKLTIGQGKRAMAGHSQCEAVLNRVDSVLSDALTYSRTLVTELSPPVLHEHGLVASLKWLAKYMHKKHELTVKVVVPDDPELKLPEDQRVLLFQAVRELLINSAKHAGTGKASLTLERRDGNIRIMVSDEGNGFDLAALVAAVSGTPNGEVFSKFGLFNIRERMRAMGGGFNIQSAIGQGTVATLSLPLASSAEPKVLSYEFIGTDSFRSALSTQHSVPHKKAIVRVLLVDDHAMVRQGLRSVLDAYPDIQIIGEAGDGEEAVRLVEELRPAVVVMDINMPKMNGIKATERIKKCYPETIVIGVSVNAAGENQEAMIQAGAARLMTKEAAVEELYDAIQHACRRGEIDRGK